MMNDRIALLKYVDLFISYKRCLIWGNSWPSLGRLTLTGGWGGVGSVLHQLGINDKWMDHASQPQDFKRLMQLSKLIRPDQFSVPKIRRVELFLPRNSDQILPESLSLRSTRWGDQTWRADCHIN